MKRLIFILILASLSLAGMADKTGSIAKGFTQMDKPFLFTAADSIAGHGGYHIWTSQTYTITIYNPQQYTQTQSITTTLATVSGSPSVLITLYGRITSSDGWTSIGTPVTWTSAGASNPVTITNTTAANYNYLRVTYVCSGAAQHVTISTFDVKTANMYPSAAITATGRITGTGGLTITAGTANLNASSNYATNINTGSSTGLLTLGNASNSTVAVASKGWSVSSAGIGTLYNLNITAVGDSIIFNPYKTLKFADFRNAAVTKFNVDTTGNVYAAGIVSAAGGYVVTGGSPVIWAKGGSVVDTTQGFNTVAVSGTRYWVEVNVPSNVTLTGVAYMVGGVGGTDSVQVNLFNTSGTLVATSKTTGTHHGVIVGTAEQFQSVAFASTYAAASGRYFASLQFNGTTARFKTYYITGEKFIAGSGTGTYDTAVGSITPGSSFTIKKGPILMTY